MFRSYSEAMNGERGLVWREAKRAERVTLRSRRCEVEIREYTGIWRDKEKT